MSNEPDHPRVEHPRHEPEIIPPGGRARRRGTFESVFIRIEEGEDGIRRVTLKRPGPFTIALIVLAVGVVVALVFVVLSALVLVWIPIVVAGILFALFSGSLRNAWQRVQDWWRGGR
ncbi:MAG: hypothetical protein K8H87_14755 [Pseudorhodoplanes sp.]|nr:hypothetical protein [Pseudorhodoplanes sp.]